MLHFKFNIYNIYNWILNDGSFIMYISFTWHEKTCSKIGTDGELHQTSPRTANYNNIQYWYYPMKDCNKNIFYLHAALNLEHLSGSFSLLLLAVEVNSSLDVVLAWLLGHNLVFRSVRQARHFIPGQHLQ